MELKISKFQEGGAAPVAPQGAPAEAQDPMMMLMQGAQQAVEGQDCQIAMQVCQMLLEMAGASQAQAAPAPQEEPVFKTGGVISRRIKK